MAANRSTYMRGLWRPHEINMYGRVHHRAAVLKKRGKSSAACTDRRPRVHKRVEGSAAGGQSAAIKLDCEALPAKWLSLCTESKVSQKKGEAVSAVLSLPRLSPRKALFLSQSTGPASKHARERLVALFDKQLRQMSETACRRVSLHGQERDDVLGEAYEQILNPKIARFAPKRGKPRQYFLGLVKNGARKVIAQVRGRRGEGSPKLRQGDVWLSQPCDQAGPQGRQDSLAEPAADVERRDAADFVLKQASPRIRQALKLLFWDDWSLQRAAAHLGTNRFALTREIRSLFLRVQGPLGGV
jgi:DNA-directed RNA polymerase specialized sigma24 family protein